MSAVLYSSDDRIAVVTLNRPEARNAVDREMALALETAVDRIEDDPEVWVAVDGLATAGGLEIVLAADVVVASSRSAFGLAEVRRNLIAAAGGLLRLPRAIGRAAAMDAILAGEPIEACRERAPQWEGR